VTITMIALLAGVIAIGVVLRRFSCPQTS
jgi:hypothetical protein